MLLFFELDNPISVCSQTLDAVNLLVLYLYANKDNTIQYKIKIFQILVKRNFVAVRLVTFLVSFIEAASQAIDTAVSIKSI
jgi:hypothetical protein